VEQRYDLQLGVVCHQADNSTAVGKSATFKSLSTEDFTARLRDVHQFPDFIALALAENLSMYRDDPEAWTGNAEFALRDVSISIFHFSLLVLTSMPVGLWSADMGRLCQERGLERIPRFVDSSWLHETLYFGSRKLCIRARLAM
jgi:hypothetical protein